MAVEKERRFFKPGAVLSLSITTFLLVGALNVGDGLKETPIPDTVNIVDYFFTQNPSQGLRSSRHGLNQVVTEKTDGTIVSYYVKFDRRFEEHVYDPFKNKIYLIQDNTDLEHGPYTAPQGMFWLPGSAAIGDEFPIRTWLWRYNQNCQPSPVLHEYTIKILERDPSYYLGGDLGFIDLLLVEYRQKNGREVFGYAKGIGWVIWDLYDNQGKILQREVFNKKTNAVSQPDFKKACKAI